MAKQTVELTPSESKLVTFEATPHEARTYQVSVDGLYGSFRALAAPVVEITAITLDKTKILGGEDFTISITFSNPHDYDVWIRPEFAFGHLNAKFVPERVLYGWDPTIAGGYDPGCIFDWVDLGGQPSGNLIPEHYGSNMTIYVYDPEGIPMVTGEHAYLKVPAKGKATTSLKWYACRPEYGTRDVCVRVEDAFYAVYDPGCGIFQGKIVNYRKVSYEPFSGVVSDIVTIGTPPGAVTIDKLEIKVNYAGAGSVEIKVTITNNTGKILISRPSDWIYTKLAVQAYAGERYSHSLGKGKTWEHGDLICTLFSTTAAGTGSSIGEIPLGTTTKTFSYSADKIGLQYYDPASHTNKRLPLTYGLPEGLKGYVTVRFYQVDQRGLTYVYGGEATELFQGVFSSQWQTWIKAPYLKEKRWIPPISGPWYHIPGHYADVFTIDGLEFQVWRYTDP